MKNYLFLALCLCTTLLYQDPILATSYTWNGGSGDWSVATNWAPNGIPGAADDVSIAAGTATLTAHTSVDDFTVTGGGQISGVFNLTINGTLTQNCFGCLLTVGSGDVIINGPFTWITGIIGNGTAGGNVIVNGLITIPDGGAGHWVRKKTLICNGGVDWQGGNIGTSDGGVWQIPVGATITESSSSNYLIYDNFGGGGVFENYGTFVKTGSSTTSCGGGIGVVSFYNYGTINHIGTGNMTFQGPMHNNTGGIIQGTGSYIFNSTFSNSFIVAPGNGIGQFTLTVPDFPNSAIQIEIGSAAGPGVGHDRLNISGNFVSSVDTLSVFLVNGYEPAPGTSFQIVSTTGTVSGEIPNVYLPGGAEQWDVIYGSTSITLTFLGEPGCAPGGILYVDADATGDNDGSSWTNAFLKLQDALAFACTCEEATQIWVAAGTYYPDEGNGQTNNLRTSTFQLCNNKAVYGGFNGTETTLSQRNWLTNITILSGDIDQVSSTTNNAYHVVTGSGTSSSARLDGFTITLGNANDLNAPHKHGGGLYISSGSPIIANCIISNNRGRDGGGMYNLTSNTQVSGCTFTGNVGEIVIGAMLNITSTPIVTNTHFISNIGGIDGGAVGNTVSNTQFWNCKFMGNSITGGSGNGAGVHNWNSSPRFFSCQFSGNKSNNRGGAIFNTTNSHSKIINCSLSGNSAGNNGGAVFNEMNSDPQITNSMIWNNRANGITTSTSASVYNLDGTCIPTCNNNLIANSGGSGGGWQSAIGSDGGNNIDANPQFILPVNPASAPTTAGNLQLTSYSPLNLGSNAAYDVFGDPQNDLDLANNPRVFEYSSSGIIDMGAYEFQGQSSCPGGAIVYVNASASGTNNGSSWANAYIKLQDALFTACSCSGINQVWVAAGTYYPDEGNGQTNNLRTSSFQLCNNKAVYGGFNGTETTLSQRNWQTNVTTLSGDIDQVSGSTNNAYHVLIGSGTGNTANLDGFTVTGGNANGGGANNNGGGMVNLNGSPTLRNLKFTANHANTLGGAMHNNASSPIILNTTFISNTSNVVGGAINAEASSHMTLTDCDFISNTGTINGGAIALSVSNPIVRNCQFIGNSSQEGGAFYAFRMVSTLTNCLFSGNRATNRGAALHFTTDANSTLINCTFSGNNATGNGGAILLWNTPNLTLKNTIIHNNKAAGSTASTSASIFRDNATANFSYCLVANSGGSGGGWQSAIGVDQGNNIASDPLFVLNVDPATAPTTAGDLHLPSGSPAINAGNNIANTYPFDLDGNPRIDDDVIDMGAFEQYIPCTPATWYADADDDGLGDPIDSTEACLAPEGFVANNDDCDDTNEEIGGPTTWYADADEDGFGDPIDSTEACVAPEGFVANNDDCDDTNEEIGSPTTWYADADEDGYGDLIVSTEACEAPEGYVTNDNDCDDTNPEIGGPTTLYVDADEDGYGDPSLSMESCVLFTGFVENNEDCDDTNNEIGGPTTWYADADADGLGNPIDSTEACVAPEGYIANDEDCDDTNEEIGGPTIWYADADEDGLGNPIDSTEACVAPDGYVANDNDCDDTNEEIGGPTIWYADADDDGLGDPNVSEAACEAPLGYVANENDCDDTNNEIGGPTTWYADTDEDGLGDPTDSIVDCLQPSGYVANDDDCNDTDSEIGGPLAWYADIDEDGLGDPNNSEAACVAPPGYVVNDDDCDDTNNEIGGPTSWYIDADNDGFGNPTDSIVDCLQPPGYAANNTDNCPAIANSGQEDFDSDMLGDVCDPDDDNDGVNDTEDGCPYDPDKSEPGICGCGVEDINASIAPLTPSIACQGDSEVLTASGGTSYLWSTGEITSSIEVAPAVTTTYAVTVSTSPSCSDTASVVVEVQNQAPSFEYTGNIGFEENVVYPTTGSPYTQYHFEVTYIDADGDMPISAFPKLQLDFEGNGLFTDPNDRSHIMQPADPGDLNVVDGKTYFYNAIGLEPGTSWETSFFAVTDDGCSGQSATYDVPDILLSPDVYLYANDISFSENHPDPDEEFTVYAVVHNASDFSADNFVVRLLNHNTGETYTDITVSSLAPHEETTVSWIINAPADPSWNPMRVTVDFQNTITESNELNNTAIRPFICGDYDLPGAIIAYTTVGPNPAYEGQGMGLYGTAYYTGTAVPLQDSSCAGATVTMTIVETNQTFILETSSNGFFSTGFIAPPPGTYTIVGEVTDYTLTGTFTNTFTVIVPLEIPCAIDYTCAFAGDFFIIEGESVAPQFIVANGGCDPATSTSSASATRQGASPATTEFIVPALGDGGSQIYNLSPITYTTPGVYTLYGVADQDDDITESREDNNVCLATISVVPNLPDIIANSHPPIDPMYLCFEQGLTFSFGNGGVAPTGQFVTRLEIFNANNELVKLETVTTANLNYQESASIGFSGYTFPATGQYTAKVTCDYPHPPGVVVESSEGNNTFEISFLVLDCGVNLVWHSICEINQGVTPVNPTNPGSITVSRRLTNAGTEDATATIPVTFEVNGNLYTEIVSPLAVGESAQVTMSLPTPTHGDNDIIFTIDPDQTLEGEDPGGNVAIEPLCWDFSLYHDSYCNPASVWNLPYLVLDQSVIFDIGLVNYGLYKASPVHVSFEVSGPGISGWLDLGEVTMNGPINKTCGCPVTVSLPYPYSFDQVGTYSIRMTADPDGVFAECNETNNQLILDIEVINVPDLKVLSQYIDPSELNPDVDEEISFNVTYQNIGMSNPEDNFELLLLVDEVPVDSVEVPGLISGGSNTVSIPNTWSSVIPGLHVVRVIIDADEQINEATESNNEATRAVIVGASVNLNFLAFTHTPPSGGSLDIEGTIRNMGSLSCTADLELYYIDDVGDEQLITTIPVTINGNSNIPFSHTWMIDDENTTLIGRIVNVSVMEYNEDDNEATSVLQVITLDIVVTEENCIGSNDGTAIVSPAGGTTPYDFQWSMGLTGPSITIGAGQYIVSVTDVNGNLTTATVAISDSGIPMQTFYLDADADGFGDMIQDTTSCTQPIGYVTNNDDCDDMNSNINPSETETCNGIDDDCDGLIDDADPGVTGQPTWFVDADSDGYGDAVLTTIACDQPSGYVANADDCNDADASIHPNATETCNETDDDCDGLIDEDTTDTDGDGICDSIDNCPSTYNPDQADNENDGIGDVCDPNDDNDPKPDNNDCAPFDPTIYPGAPEICGDLTDNDCDNKIDEALKIIVLMEQDVLCYGDSTGMISVSGECGLPPYSYLWNNGSTSATITNLAIGQYKVTVTDAQGLTKSKTFNITQPSALSLTMTKTDVSCFGGNDGTAKATPQGGNGPYTYLWSSGATTKIATGLSQGTYTVTVTDENGCMITGTIAVGEPVMLEITNTIVSPDPAHPGKFMITVTAEGGTPYDNGYRYRRCNTSGSGCNGWQVSNELTNLNPGSYLVKVKDANGCIDELIVDIEPVQSMVAVIEQIEMDVDNVRVEPVDIIPIETEVEPVHFDFTSLYPNPGKEMVIVQWDASGEEMVNIVLHDIHGRKIMSKMIEGKSGHHSMEMDMSSLSEGLYIITLHRANLKYSKVWIKIE